MTDFDKKLIEKAEKFSRWEYFDIRVLIDIADTECCKRQLSQIYCELADSAYESV